MRHRPITDHLAELLGAKIPLTRVADIPVGSLVVQLSDYEAARMGEITEQDLEDPGFAAEGVSWLGFPRVGPELAYIATPEFRKVISEYTVEEAEGFHPGDLAALRWFDDPTWYINVLEVTDTVDDWTGEKTLGFRTLPGSYGTLDTADGWVQISAGRKEWSPRPRR